MGRRDPEMMHAGNVETANVGPDARTHSAAGQGGPGRRIGCEHEKHRRASTSKRAHHLRLSKISAVAVPLRSALDRRPTAAMDRSGAMWATHPIRSGRGQRLRNSHTWQARAKDPRGRLPRPGLISVGAVEWANRGRRIGQPERSPERSGRNLGELASYASVIFRAPFAEDALAAAITTGVRQCVQIGAGFDFTRRAGRRQRAVSGPQALVGNPTASSARRTPRGRMVPRAERPPSSA
jgi:leucine carboxyl methyltransferase